MLMKLLFAIDYRTNWGESVYISGNIPELGNGDEAHAVKFEFSSIESWSAEIDIADTNPSFEYHYIIRHENGDIRREWGQPHFFRKGRNVKSYEIYDCWQEQPSDKPYYTSAFTNCICHRAKKERPLNMKNGIINLRVYAPMLKNDEVLAICGSTEVIGNWNPAKAVVMNDAFFPEWNVNLVAKAIEIPFEYKFVILKKDTHEIVAWENGSNRTFNIIPAQKDEVLVLSGMRFANPLTPWRGAGTAIPVFALRSEEDFGVGDFFDLKKMVDWAAKTGQKFLQILPINDTTMTNTWTDSYPYNANSAFALHPMYLRLSKLGVLNDAKRQSYFDKLGKRLNKLKEIDYEQVNQVKNLFTHEIFVQNGKKVLSSKAFKAFVEHNKYWLMPYAAFCVLRDRFGTPDFSKWDEYASYDEKKILQFVANNQNEINYVYYIQFNLNEQLCHVHEYAHSKGVAIKGDIPIGISRTSVDTWIAPQLFNMDCQAGAPPDDFSVLGQNWGFPTYNWAEMSNDRFAWWNARFNKMSEYFDAYRIDHILGFFRIWQIPMDAVHGLLGMFNPALPYTLDELKNDYDFWIDEDLHTTPYIMDHFIGIFFGEYVNEARKRFLNDIGSGRYKLKPQFDTQRKVVEYFANNKKSKKNDKLCDALLCLIDNVLFVEDYNEKRKYHPRISAQSTYIYQSLTDYEKWCFDRLYNDFYYHRHNDYWQNQAIQKLSLLIDATNMLVCAEDLGMIPDCVPTVINKLQILSLEIQRMPKVPYAEFGNTWSYPYYSVCTTSTHDMCGIRQWWEKNHDRAQHFFRDMLHESDDAPLYAEPWICDKIVDLHLNSPSMLCILPLQDWLSINGNIRRENPQEEQINVPANPHYYWRYRMHLTIEKLLVQNRFNKYLKEKITSSGR